MIQAQTQAPEYWGAKFALTESDIEQLFNYFLETEKPQTIDQLARVLMNHRVAEELRALERSAKDRQIYRPHDTYEVGTELLFPALKFAEGRVASVRPGFNPQDGNFQVIAVEISGKKREFATDFQQPHPLNSDETTSLVELLDLDTESLYRNYGLTLAAHLSTALLDHGDFVKIGPHWFAKSLLAEVNVGHLHLAEAVLEMSEGGPLEVVDILPNLDIDPNIDQSARAISLNYAMLNDERFEDVGGKNKITWFLRRLQPEAVKETPARLKYRPIDYDKSSLSPQLRLLEQELDDEWSDLKTSDSSEEVVLPLTFPHRWAGTLPLNSRLRPLFATGRAPRQRVLLLDDESGEQIVSWAVLEGRYVYGLGDWYEEQKIPVGGFIHIVPTAEPGVLTLGYERRRPQREWIRLASALENRIQFELKRRAIGAGYDDLLVVGTDVVAAIDALWRRADANNRSLESLLVELFSTLTDLTPQNNVHAKTLYSAMNMLRRTPPGPIFAELVNNPAFQTVGDHYWVFDESRRQRSN